MGNPWNALSNFRTECHSYLCYLGPLKRRKLAWDDGAGRSHGYDGSSGLVDMLEDFSLLPEELWRRIFWKIDTSTIARVGLTSTQWRSLVWRFTVQLVFGHDTGDTGLFRRLITFTNLESLTIYSSEVANRALLRYADMLDSQLCLRELTLDSNSLGRALVNLHLLDLSGCDELTDQALLCVSCLGNLRSLNLHLCTSITGKGLKAVLAPLTHLEALNLTDTRVVARDSVASIVKLSRSLRSLSLGYCDVNNQILKQLAELTELTQLDLSECQHVNDAGMDAFLHLTNLTELSLMALPITSVGLRYLGNCTRLENLSLSGCEDLTDDAMFLPASLPRLRILNLWGCDKLTDIGVKQYIVKISSLEILHVEFCHKLTDESVRALAAMPHLNYIGHNGCPHITPATVRTLLSLW